MNYDLLHRMMEKDMDAFLELTDRYGWSLYSAIRKKHPDKAEADRIYNETMNVFYRSLQNPDCEDPLEAVLVGLSGQIGGSGSSVVRDAFAVVHTDSESDPPKLYIDETSSQVNTAVASPKRNRGGFWYGLGLILVFTGILASLWIIAGLLMDMNYIPFIDLGYSWFNNNVIQWF